VIVGNDVVKIQDTLNKSVSEVYGAELVKQHLAPKTNGDGKPLKMFWAPKQDQQKQIAPWLTWGSFTN